MAEGPEPPQFLSCIFVEEEERVCMYDLLGVKGGWLARGDRCGKGARGSVYCNLHFCRCWCWFFGWIMSTSVAAECWIMW